MGIKWDSRLKLGIVVLIAGLILSYIRLSFSDENVVYAGKFCVKAGIMFCFWGGFYTMRDWKYNKSR